MDDQKHLKLLTSLIRIVIGLFLSTLLLAVLGFYFHYFYVPEPKFQIENISEVTSNDAIVDGIHVATGFKDDQYLDLVISNCTACHSSKLVTQNRASKEGWIGMIRWMQETQKLWDLGENENKIVEYLSKNYAPIEQGRRQPLSNIEWYELD